jgi:hypothetical protein
MPKGKNTIETLGDVLLLVEASVLPPYQRRDMRSAINRIAEMAGWCRRWQRQRPRPCGRCSRGCNRQHMG